MGACSRQFADSHGELAIHPYVLSTIAFMLKMGTAFSCGQPRLLRWAFPFLCGLFFPPRWSLDVGSKSCSPFTLQLVMWLLLAWLPARAYPRTTDSISVLRRSYEAFNLYIGCCGPDGAEL